MTSQIKEGSSEPLTITFKNEDGDLVVPTSVTYRIDDVSTGQSILADTNYPTPTSTITITILPAYTAILNQTNLSELREVTVKSTFAGGKAQNLSIPYEVVNLRFI